MAEVKAWMVGVGELKPFAIGKLRRGQKAAMDFIAGTKGFLGIHPVPGHGTLLVYRTENDAKIARNELLARGCPCGDNIGTCYVDEKDITGE